MFKQYLRRRLAEPSTWAGIILAGSTIYGAALAPAELQAYAQTAAAVATAIGGLLFATKESGDIRAREQAVSKSDPR